MNTNDRRVVLVSGASSGFGRLIAESLARRGHRVFAGVRDVQGRNATATHELTAFAAGGLLSLDVVELDVTDQASADGVVTSVIASEGRIDVVINNAGMIMPGPLEAFTAEEAQRQFDVNVFGALRLNRAAIPQLRAQGHGLLVQIGSLGGHVAIPYSGLYSASKAALGSLSETWRQELAPYGIESIIVEPASYRTNIGANAVMPGDMARMGIYGERLGQFIAALTAKQANSSPDDVAEVSDAVVALVEMDDGTRPVHTAVAPMDQVVAVNKLVAEVNEVTRAVAEGMGVESFVTPSVN